ncbi:NlpC/P60 family protein [Streptomyces sp. NPDC090106]|uniref:NlpC/P60 family protein n=1 Tax=Streptomyces sp. NPDC090106 TaxID=3365946 RepID=UPI0038084831
MDARKLALAIAGRGGGLLKYKLMGAAFVVFTVCLLLVGAIGGGGGQAYGSSCGDRGTPDVDYGDDAQNPGDADTREQQIANAETIDDVAESGGLSGRATLIALMTALQESTLLNIDYGHADSLGLFQQRPSQGWGSKEDIMKPKYAAGMFFFGSDRDSAAGIDGLTDIPGWESMQMWEAAAAVQHPAEEYEQLYAGQETAARQIAHEAGIDLDRPAKNGAVDDGQADDDANGDDGQAEDSCYPEDGADGTPGDPFHDGAADWPAEVANPRSTADAIAWAKHEAEFGAGTWYRACLAFVARTYGWTYSGVGYAIDHYKEMPASMKHDKDRNPPPGALMYWDTGQRAGHVAIYLGDGQIASNDIVNPGYIDVVPATDIETKWGATYLGWAPPYFPKGG